MFGWFRRKKPAPPVAALPSIVVRATGAATGAGQIGPKQALPPGALRMEDVMGAAALAAMEEGIVDHAMIRERKLQAREALKTARAEVLATGKPVEFSSGSAKFVVAP